MRIKRYVTLTTAEQTWLGATVRRSDGLEGQVWALSRPASGRHQKGSLWIAHDGEVTEANIADVVRVDTSTQPVLES